MLTASARRGFPKDGHIEVGSRPNFDVPSHLGLIFWLARRADSIQHQVSALKGYLHTGAAVEVRLDDGERQLKGGSAYTNSAPRRLAGVEGVGQDNLSLLSTEEGTEQLVGVFR